MSGAGDSCDWLLVEFQTRPPASFNARRRVDAALLLSFKQDALERGGAYLHVNPIGDTNYNKMNIFYRDLIVVQGVVFSEML